MKDLSIMKYKIFLTLTFAVVALSGFAQRGKKKIVPASTPSPAEVHAEMRFEEMLPSTQRVLFIDSIVVDKNKVLSTIGLDPEIGKADSISYTDGRGLRTFYCTKDSKGKTKLYTASKIDGKWGDERIVSGLDSIENICYPFMLADGTTLCFAAKSEDAIGGFDIFMTRYDDEECAVMKPESVGLPFCSKADDYIYYIDQRDSLGWFVSERNQPKGKACIYIFETNGQRLIYNDNEYNEEEIVCFAHLNSIRNTWKDNVPERMAAKERLAALNKRLQQKNYEQDFTLVLSDNLVYHNWANFHSTEAKQAYLNAVTLQSKYDRLAEETETLRKKYTNSNDKNLKDNILANEEELLSMVNKIEKQTKNAVSLELKKIK